MLYKKSWGTIGEDNCPQLSVCYERLASRTFYGPFVHARTKQLNHAPAYKYIRDLELAGQYSKDNSPFYPFYSYMDPAFNSMEDFINILPSNRIATARSAAATLFQLALKLEGPLDHVSENFKL